MLLSHESPSYAPSIVFLGQAKELTAEPSVSGIVVHSFVPEEEQLGTGQVNWRLEDPEAERPSHGVRQARRTGEQVVGGLNQKWGAEEARDLRRDVTMLALPGKDYVGNADGTSLRSDEHVALGEVAPQREPTAQSGMISSGEDGETVGDEPALSNTPGLVETDPGNAALLRRDSKVDLAFCQSLTGRHRASSRTHADPRCNTGEVLQKWRKQAHFCEVCDGEHERLFDSLGVDLGRSHHDVPELGQSEPKRVAKRLGPRREHEVITGGNEKRVTEEVSEPREPMTNCGLRDADSFSRTGDASDVEQNVESEQQVEIESMEGCMSMVRRCAPRGHECG
jgi:hypothetical protein